jgi:hypothetical protein
MTDPSRVAIVSVFIAFALSIGSPTGALPMNTTIVPPASNVWVYSLVSADYDGCEMLPHFLAHYQAMGVPISNFYFDLQHDPAESDMGLQVIPPHTLHCVFGTPRTLPHNI